MVLSVKNIIQRKSGLFYFRKGIPQEIRSRYNGKREIVKSLQTRVMAEAVRKAKVLDDRYSKEFEALRSGNDSFNREFAVNLLGDFGLEPLPIDRQFKINDELIEDGNPYDLFIEHLGLKADAGGYFDDSRLAAHERKALEIIKGREKVSLDDVRDWSHKKKVGNKKAIDEERRFFDYFKDNGVPLHLENVRRRDVVIAVDKIVENGKSTATVKKALDRVRKLMREYLLEHEIEMANPFDKVAVPKLREDAESHKPFTNRELVAIKTAVEESDSSIISAMIAGLLFDTGCRIGEVGGIKRVDFVLDGEHPFMSLVDNKHRKLKNSNSKRLVPLTGLSLLTAKKLIEATPDDQEFIFDRYNSSETFKNDAASAAVRKWINKRASGKVAHSFRHTLTDRLRRASIPIHDISNILGWATGKMADHYGDSEAVERFHNCLNKMHQFESDKELFDL